jgi:hypothetical protein
MTDQSRHDLQELFGSFRAEWLRERLFSLFNEPDYFPSLIDNRPCVLTGGRGTGKTTVLRCMSYEGQFALLKGDPAAFSKQPFVGLYHRVNTNRVTAFNGPEQTEAQWNRAFSHYVNLTIVDLILQYLHWHATNINAKEMLAGPACRRIGETLGVTGLSSFEALSAAVASAIESLELYVNNLDGPAPTFSMLQSPIDAAIQEARKLPGLSNKTFYIMLDEYENFLGFQQQIVNTLIKHSSDAYIFKIGVKELGWRVKYTLNENEQLISPADYELIHIEQRLEGNFSAFARRVCEARIEQWASENGLVHLPLDELLPDLTYEREAQLLGVVERVGRFVQELRAKESDAEKLLSTSELALYVFWMLYEQQYELAVEAVRAFVSHDRKAINQYNNYKYAMLFAIARNGAEISKFYCGNRVFALLARNNIRFYLHLISSSIEKHLRNGGLISEPVPYQAQTEAAREVGLRYLTELEGVTVQGAQLVKLVLGFGRLFQILSRNPIGGAPETVEFQLKGGAHTTEVQVEKVQGLLREAIMQLALVRSPGTKLAAESETRDWNYGVHPIFAPYFSFSHRKKRKIDVLETEILNMITSPQETIKRLLKDRAYLAEQEAPVQLKLFDEYYGKNATIASS